MAPRSGTVSPLTVNRAPVSVSMARAAACSTFQRQARRGSAIESGQTASASATNTAHQYPA